MSLCNPPTVTLPQPASVLAAILAAFAALGIAIPAMPSIPLPAPYCALD
jgi:hypothetical protein